MTTYAPTFTPRLRVHYKVGGIAHSLQVRGTRGASLATMESLKDPVANCFVAVAAFLYDDFEWISAEVALTDSEIFSPVAVSGIVPVGAVALGTTSAVLRIRGLTISGRAPGSRGRFTMFGLSLPQGDVTSTAGDGVLTAAELPALVTIKGLADTYFKANSGDATIWYSRGTYKGNDHLLKLVRRGIIS